MSTSKIPSVITDSNQACLPKVTAQRGQEEVRPNLIGSVEGDIVQE